MDTATLRRLAQVLRGLSQLTNLNLARTLRGVVAFVVCVRVELGVAALTRWGVVVCRQWFGSRRRKGIGGGVGPSDAAHELELGGYVVCCCGVCGVCACGLGRSGVDTVGCGCLQTIVWVQKAQRHWWRCWAV